MKLVRFLVQSYVEGMIREAGTEHLIGDDVPLNAHMVDVDTEVAGDLPAPGHMIAHKPRFLDHSGDSKIDSSASGYYTPPEE